MRLVPCSACRRHVKEREARCPFCGGERLAQSGSDDALVAERIGIVALVAVAAAGGVVGCARSESTRAAPSAASAATSPSASADARATALDAWPVDAGSPELRTPVPVYGSPPMPMPHFTGDPYIGSFGVNGMELAAGAAIIRTVQGMAYACFEELRRHDASLEGRLYFTLVIAPNGHVSTARIEPGHEATNRGLPRLAACIEERVRSSHFAARDAGGAATISFAAAFYRNGGG